MTEKFSMENPVTPPRNQHGKYTIGDVHAPHWFEENGKLFLEGSADVTQSFWNPCYAVAGFRMEVQCKAHGFALGAKHNSIARIYDVPFWDSQKIWYKDGYPEDDQERFQLFCKECGIE